MAEYELFARQGFEGTLVVENYLSDLAIGMFRISPGELPRLCVVKGLALRAVGFIQALARLDQIAHIQLSLSANRALLEVLVDLILISQSTSSEVLEKFEAWELSTQLKAALATITYIKERQGHLTELEEPLVNFTVNQESHIRELRRRFWPGKDGKGIHPNRWTGSNLLIDVQEADRLQGTKLEWFYQTEYRRMNWLVHGSTLAGFRGVNTAMLEAWYGGSHSRASSFAMDVAKIVLEQLGGFSGQVKATHERAETEWELRHV